MVSEIRIYYEGADELKRGFSTFFQGIVQKCRSMRLRWTLVSGESASETHKDFRRALRDYPNALNLLLVDAEEAVNTTQPWEHLACRNDHKLRKPRTATADHAHLMVQVMESWFLADRQALAQYYGSGFLPNRLPAGTDVEAVAKNDILDGLSRAAAETKKKGYYKTIHAPEILSRLDPAKVRAASPWCDRLFTTLQSAIDGQE